MEIGESSAAGAARETLEEANAAVHILGPYAHWDIPVIGQVRVTLS
jgi:ADP-ribose/FAD diphosphatase